MSLSRKPEQTKNLRDNHLSRREVVSNSSTPNQFRRQTGASCNTTNTEAVSKSSFSSFLFLHDTINLVKEVEQAYLSRALVLSHTRPRLAHFHQSADGDETVCLAGFVLGGVGEGAFQCAGEERKQGGGCCGDEGEEESGGGEDGFGLGLAFVGGELEMCDFGE